MDENNVPMDLEKLIRDYSEKAYNFAYRLSGNAQDAADLVQEGYVRAIKNWNKYDPSRPFISWLYKIIHNIFLDGKRRLSRKNTVSLDALTLLAESPWDEFIPGNDEDPMDPLVRRERDELVQTALNSLPVPYRTVLILCDMEGLSYEEIGRITAAPPGTVRSRIHQGRNLMRRAFERLNGPKGETTIHERP